MPVILAYLAASLLYALLGWHFWRTKWRTADRAAAGSDAAPADRWARFAMLAPLLLQGYTLYVNIFAGQGLTLGVGNTVSAIVWLTVSIYFLANFFYKLEGLQTLISPVAAAAVLLPLLLPGTHPLANTEFPAFRVHLLIALLAYSLFTIAALHAVLMDLVERRLHHAARPGLFATLPPLLTMESLLFRVLWTGFILLTLTLATGIVFSEELFGKALTLSHKTLFGFVSWAIFAALLGGRVFYGWRGRVAVRWTIAGFIALFLAYVGSKFVLEVVLGRG
jgi:ABC-type uncharacterized transport system permease subunit